VRIYNSVVLLLVTLLTNAVSCNGDGDGGGGGGGGDGDDNFNYF
jgi:hypothetical protein